MVDNITRYNIINCCLSNLKLLNTEMITLSVSCADSLAKICKHPFPSAKIKLWICHHVEFKCQGLARTFYSEISVTHKISVNIKPTSPLTRKVWICHWVIKCRISARVKPFLPFRDLSQLASVSVLSLHPPLPEKFGSVTEWYNAASNPKSPFTSEKFYSVLYILL